MKKIYLSLCLLISAVSASFGQTIANAGMETWRTIFIFTSPLTPAHAPNQWFGDDSLILGMGPIIASGDTFYANLFKSTSFKHSGTASAKLLTLRQGSTFGNVPAMLTNAEPTVDVSGGGGGGGSITDLLTFTGGTPTTLRTQTVSAYVAYFPGIDTTTHMMGGADSGMLMVQAVAVVGGIDSVIGIGFAPIPASDTFVEITATVNYIDTYYTTDIVRIIFASSGGAMEILDSSTLYVDDVSMYGTPQTPPPPPVDHTGVGSVAKGNAVTVYPNPANNMLYFGTKLSGTLRCHIMSADGRAVATKIVTGNTSMDISQMAAGTYFYFLTDEKNTVIQNGKVNVRH
jgi:hypothetical protein